MKILKQEARTSCGIACIRSVMNNFGGNFSEKDVRKVHESYFPKPESELNPMLNLAITVLKLGFNVKYYNYNHIFVGNFKSGELRESLEMKKEKYFGYGKYYIERALEFLDLGGEFILDKLNKEKIQGLINEGKYPVVQIRTCFLRGMGNIGNRHKVILSKYDEKGFYFLNPSNEKEEFVDYDTFYLCFYQDGPEMLIIDKKK